MTDQPRRGLPILGQLSPLSAAFLVGTVVLSLAAMVLDFGLHADHSLLFIVSAGAILGLAWVVGLSTERLGSITGPQVGGILNATFGNIAELIIAFFALQAGLIEVVKASLTGSIIGNLLLVLGLSALVGGLRNGSQHFSAKIAVSNIALLVLALIGLFVPAIFALTTHEPTQGSITQESVLVAIVLIVGYVLSLIFQFSHPNAMLGAEVEDEGGGPPWSGRTAIVVLLGAAVLLAVLSEILVSSIEPFIASFGLSFFFVGVVIIPTIG
ncbi:MAG: cation transporter, partial [Chloroflexota bacterium]